MKSKIVISFVILLLIAPFSIYAQTSAPTDEAAVRQVVQYYIDGWISEDIESIRKAFHPKAKLLSISDKYDLKEITLKDVESAFKDNRRRHVTNRRELGIKMNVISIDLVGDAAVAKVETTNPKSEILSFDYLSLKKFGEGWRIVSRVSSVINKQEQRAMR